MATKGIKRVAELIGLLTLVFFVASCERKPEKELKDAQGVLKELEELGAPQYAPDDWQAVKSKFEDAQAKIEMRKYREAKELLSSIIADAPAIKQKVEEEKKKAEEMKQAEQQYGEQVTPPEGGQQ